MIIQANGFVAQLVEQLTLNQLVVGSSPTGPSFLKTEYCPLGREPDKTKFCMRFERERAEGAANFACGTAA